MARLRDYFGFAWATTRPHADKWWFVPLGGAVAGAVVLIWGRPMNWLPQNDLLHEALILLICVLAAYVLVFLGSLCWAPIHFALKPRGGLRAILRSNLGNDMWPVILMVSGLVAFVLLFGVGSVWLTIQTLKGNIGSTAPGPQMFAPAGPVTLASEVEGHIKALDRLYAALEQSGEQLYQKTSDLSFPWLSQFPWQPRRTRMGQSPEPATLENVRAAVPKIQELATFQRQMMQEINAAVSQYPYDAYLSLTLAYSCGVSECIFHSVPDMARNFYTVSARPGHERNLIVPDFAAHGRDRVAEGQDRFWIPCSGSRLELS